ncbi:MAG: hypothetical protein OEZ08_08025 [Betaproteobacteria bacterium]|nr:hypothetical protein [Betaproteobacteria bacterium]
MSSSLVSTGDLISAVQFQEELRRAGRFCPRSVIVKPLDEAVKAVAQNPACVQSRLLTRLLAALTYQCGEFRRADVSALDTPALMLTISLMDACAAGTSTDEEWIHATEAARAAEAGA